MSQFLPDGFAQPVKPIKVNTQGTQTPLTPEELELQRRLFASVETLPPEFKSWVGEYPIVYGQAIPGSNVTGGSLPIQQVQILGNENISSTSYVNTATIGPQVTGLSDGTYLLIFGCNYYSTAGGDGWYTPAINDAAANDNDAAFMQPLDPNRYSISRAVSKVLANNNNNTITMKYKVSSGSNGFANRWLVVMRTGR